MRIYIAGKITDLDYEEAESKFMWAEMLLEKAGHTPLNPLKLVDQTTGRCQCGHVPGRHPRGICIRFGCDCDLFVEAPRPYNECLADALKVMLTEADGVYFLDNWHESIGAQIEAQIAIRLKMPIYYAASDLPIGSDWPERAEFTTEDTEI